MIVYIPFEEGCLSRRTVEVGTSCTAQPARSSDIGPSSIIRRTSFPYRLRRFAPADHRSEASTPPSGGHSLCLRE